jgi:hypothetical protein
VAILLRALAFPIDQIYLSYSNTNFKYPLLKNGRIVKKDDPRYKGLLEKLPGNEIKKEMKGFLEAHGIRKDIIFHERNNSFILGAGGSNIAKKSDSVVMILPGFYQQDKSACTWAIKHEISHIKNNDNLVVPSIRAICGIAIAIFSIMYLSPVAGYFFCIALNHLIGISLWIWREGKADDFAIKNSSVEELRGGLRLIKSMQRVNIARRTSFFNRIFFSESGENRSDLNHPSLDSRIKKIENELRKRNVELVNEDHTELTHLFNQAYNPIRQI